MKTHSVYCGIDVSKRTLHLATADQFVGEFPNNVAGHKKLVAKLGQLQPQLIVLEASGGYERSICEALQDAGLPVAIVQPGRVRHFAKSLHVLAKTDRLDAQIIAKFGAATSPRIAEKTTPRERKLRALIDRREQIVSAKATAWKSARIQRWPRRLKRTSSICANWKKILIGRSMPCFKRTIVCAKNRP